MEFNFIRYFLFKFNGGENMQQLQELIELEAQSYIHKKILKEYTNKVKLLEPAPPSLILDKNTSIIEDPDNTYTGTSEKMDSSKQMIFISLVLFPLCYLFSAMIGGKKEILCQILGFIFLFASLFFFVYFFKSIFDYRKAKNRVLKNYRYNKTKFLLEKERLEKVNKWNDVKSEVYEENVEKYDEKLAEHHKRYHPILDDLNAVDRLFNQIISKRYEDLCIESRYQNLIALCSIKDYLNQSRCQTIQEACGIFLNEFRTCKVVGILSEVENNTEAIKENQPTLYEIIMKSYEKIYEILDHSFYDEVIMKYIEEQKQFLQNYS